MPQFHEPGERVFVSWRVSFGLEEENLRTKRFMNGPCKSNSSETSEQMVKALFSLLAVDCHFACGFD